MRIAQPGQSRVAVPSVSVNATARGHRRLDQPLERLCGSIGHTSQANTPHALCHLLRRRSPPTPCGPPPGPACLPPCRPRTLHRLPPCPTRHPAPDEPSRGATCAANSRRCDNSPTPKHAASPGRWPRASGWSPTKRPGTTVAEASGCLGKWSRRWRKLDRDTAHTSAAPVHLATLDRAGTVGRQNPPATGAVRDTPGRPRQFRNARRTPVDLADNLRPQQRTLPAGGILSSTP